MKSVFAATSLFAAIVFSAAPVLADEFKTLPEGAGRDTMIKVCSKCHSPENVSLQSLDAAGWKDMVAQMKDNGAEATEAEFAAITSYLTTAFPAK